MSRYHPSTQYASPANAGPGQDAARVDLVRHDRDGSLSDSETSTSFNAYSDNIKDDAHVHDSDDPYLALTSQTLNADGTPKRPMNAFMIFARKRRPQISAANQMMRTGDVSKILSKEWNSMEMSEKKFYLDQAKKLKDNFNSKYPDYVYRRRPNNSRKKRKPEAAHDDAHDAGHLGDPDDPAYEDTSPIDADDALMIPSPQEVQYTRAHTLNPSPVYHAHAHDSVGPPPPPPACTYPYSSDFHAAHSRLPHLAPEPALPGTTVGAVRPSSMHDLNGLSQGYPSQSLYQNAGHGHGHHPHSSSMYGGGGAPHSQQHSPSGLWDPSRSGAGPRSEHSRSNWPVLPALDISLARQRSYPSSAANANANGGGAGLAANGKSDAAYSPQLPNRPWSSATSSTASSSSSASTSQHYGSSAFPTLSSAFFPSDSSPGAKGIDVSSPASSHAPQSAHDYYSSSAGPLQPAGVPGAGRRGSTGPGQDHYAPGSGSQYGSGGQQNAAQAWSQHFSRTGAGGQRVSGLHPISTYSLQASPGGGEGSSRSASGSSAHSTAQLNFWDDRFGGR
ncbi:hypothetical protein OH77DRAFT_643253 [Trametes cingulata]|nr:hypothetical protein OH77DRAFT_643253 [Trametes cingulata]